MKNFTSIKKSIAALLLSSVSLFAFSQSADIMISEYVEGQNNNRAIEIYNGTGTTVDLSQYSLKQSYNGYGFGNTDKSQNDIRYILPLTGTLAHGEVIVFANGYALPAVLEVADYSYIYEASVTANTIPGCNVLSYSGNDAIGLFNGETLIDVIGVEDEAPDGGWEVGGIEKGTRDYTLVRKGIKGNTDWAVSAGTNLDNTEWFILERDEFSYLGFHEDNSDPSSVESTLKQFVKISNTTNDVISIELAEKMDNILLINSQGQVIRIIEPTAMSHMISTKALSSGVYFIEITKSSERAVFKVLVP